MDRGPERRDQTGQDGVEGLGPRLKDVVSTVMDDVGEIRYTFNNHVVVSQS